MLQARASLCAVPPGITCINPVELMLLRVLASHVALSAEVIAEAPNALPLQTSDLIHTTRVAEHVGLHTWMDLVKLIGLILRVSK